jgi:hypothetical protein
MSGRNGNKGRIITGPGDSGGPEEPEQEDATFAPIPPMNNYWVVWFNPGSEKIERVMLQAHTVEVYETGMLVFKAFVRNTDAEMLKLGAPPVYGYYVRSFCGHITFGQDPPTEGLVH